MSSLLLVMSKPRKDWSFEELIKEKQIIDGKWFGFSSLQGYRPSMEDVHQHLIHLGDHDSWKQYSYFSIFDGHSGSGTARYAAKHLHTHILDEFNQILDQKQKQSDDKIIHQKELLRALRSAFMNLDEDLRKNNTDKSGAVCIACLISPNEIYLLNVGDARAIIIGEDGEILTSTYDHKPDDPNEKERVHEAGGRITKKSKRDVPRVEERLAMTRVLGDFVLDKHIVPPIPDIFIYPRKTSPEFIVLASDGIWNVMSNEEVASFIFRRISKSTPLDQIASQLIDHALNKKSDDNMSVYIIQV